MRLNKLNAKNKNIDLYSRFYILFMKEKTKKQHPNKYPNPSWLYGCTI